MSGYSRTNKQKIINDPIYGFIKVPSDLVFDLIEHPYFQRLRRIRQLGMTYYVYPGANHTRFQHALGAMHLMGQATDIIRSKGQFTGAAFLFDNAGFFNMRNYINTAVDYISLRQYGA